MNVGLSITLRILTCYIIAIKLGVSSKDKILSSAYLSDVIEMSDGEWYEYAVESKLKKKTLGTVSNGNIIYLYLFNI
jgi:hypothetical protein